MKKLDMLVRQCFPQQVGKQGDVGIELEIEFQESIDRIVYDGLIPRDWTAKKEGSLRGYAWEFISRGTFEQKDVSNKVKDLFRVIISNNEIAGSTYRCSTHIHLNVQKQKWVNTLGLIILSVIAEPYLLRLCGPTRDGNLFCLPSYDTGDFPRWVRNLLKWLQEEHGAEGNTSFPKRGKYNSINIDSVKQFGSIEYRCFPLSTNPEEIQKWVDILCALRSYSLIEEDKTYYTKINKVYNEPSFFIWDLFREESTYETERLIKFGCKHAFEISRELQTWSEKNGQVFG